MDKENQELDLLCGAFPVIPTPFDGSGDIAKLCLESVTEYIVSTHVDGVVFPGLASEYSDLTTDERLESTALVGQFVNGRVPFVVGASSPDPAQSIEFAVAGAQAGAVCAMVMAPLELAEDEKGMVKFFDTLAESAGIPIMLQNAPPPMGAGLDTDVIVRILDKVPGIHYVKEETVPNGQRVERLLNKPVGSLRGVFGGAGGRYIMDELRRGALGTVPASELSEMHVLLTQAYARGDEDLARDLFVRMLPILNLQAVYRCSLTKEILRLRGIIKSSYVRASGPKMDATDIQELVRFWRYVEDYMGSLNESPESSVASPAHS